MHRWIIFLIVFILLFSGLGHSDECRRGGVVVVFSNGMMNESKDAYSSSRALSKFIHENLSPDHRYFIYDTVHLARNQHEKLLLEAAEVVSQKYAEEANLFLNLYRISVQDFFRIVSLSGYYPSKITGFDWFWDAIFEVSKRYSENAYWSKYGDVDLNRQLSWYQFLLGAGYKIIVVAHSQGNFYANNAYQILQDKNFKVISVATPSHRTPGKYITLREDKVISGVVNRYSEVLEPRHSNNRTTGDRDLFGHNFVNSYLLGDESGPVIKGYLENAIEDLVGNCIKDPFRITSLEFPSITMITPSADELESRLKIGWDDAPPGNLDIVYTNISCPDGWGCPQLNQPVPRSSSAQKNGSHTQYWGCVAPNGRSDGAPASFTYSTQIFAADGLRTEPREFSYTCVNPPSDDPDTPGSNGEGGLGGPGASCSNGNCRCVKPPNNEVYFTSNTGAITCCITPDNEYVGVDYRTTCQELVGSN